MENVICKYCGHEIIPQPWGNGEYRKVCQNCGINYDYYDIENFEEKGAEKWRQSLK